MTGTKYAGSEAQANIMTLHDIMMVMGVLVASYTLYKYFDIEKKLYG